MYDFEVIMCRSGNGGNPLTCSGIDLYRDLAVGDEQVMPSRPLNKHV